MLDQKGIKSSNGIKSKHKYVCSAVQAPACNPFTLSSAIDSFIDSFGQWPNDYEKQHGDYDGNKWKNCELKALVQCSKKMHCKKSPCSISRP